MGGGRPRDLKSQPTAAAAAFVAADKLAKEAAAEERRARKAEEARLAEEKRAAEQACQILLN